MTDLDHYKRNVKAINGFNFFRMFLVIIPVLVPYFISLGLSMREIFELQAIFGFTVGVFEVPSGYLCDLIGRKRTIMLGSFISGCGFSWLYFIDSYQQLVLYEIVIAFALSLESGSDVSLLYDSLKYISDDRKERTKAIGNLQFSSRLGESLASIIGGLLVKVSYKAVLFAHLIAGWFPFIVSFFLVEPPYERMSRSDHFKNIKKIFVHLFRSDKLLVLIFVNLVIWSLSTFIAVWIFQKYWQEGQVELHYFGFLWAGYNLLVGVVAKQVHSWEKRWGPLSLLIAVALFPIFAYFGMAYVTGWFGVFVGLLFQVSRGINQVILKDALNWRTPSEFRATANSLVSLFFRIGFSLVGPLVGYLIDAQGLSATFCYLGASFLAFFLFLMVPLLLEVKKIDTDVIPSH